jgi:hypothetical protein
MTKQQTINTLAQSLEIAILSCPRDKGLASAKLWVAALTPILAMYPSAIANMNSWVACGVGKSSSGVAYKAIHNKGVFPSEQLFCNTRAKARRPLSTVCKAIALALVENVPYNPDRFQASLSLEGLEQSLTQFNIAPERIEKAIISQSIAGLKLNNADKKLVSESSKALVESVDSGTLLTGSELKRDHTAKALEVSATIEAIVAKYSKPKAVKPEAVKPEAVKPEVEKKAGREPRAA